MNSSEKLFAADIRQRKNAQEKKQLFVLMLVLFTIILITATLLSIPVSPQFLVCYSTVNVA